VLILLTVREARKLFQCVSIKPKRRQGATVETILVDEFTSLAMVVWVCLLVTTMGDLFSRTDLCVWKKAAWTVVVLIVPMGAFAYMAVQTRAITDRKGARLSLPDGDPHRANAVSVFDEVAEAARLVPIIQHAIEIRGILEVEHPLSMMDEPDQIGVCELRAESGHSFSGASDRNNPCEGDDQKDPAVAA
jgi:hypothetical protein